MTAGARATQRGSHEPIIAIVLAAGLGRRFGGDKLLALLGGTPLLAHVLRVAMGAVRAGRVAGVIGVTPTGSVLTNLVREAGATARENPDPARGLASSLRIGLDAASEAGAALILLGDQPLVSPATIDALADAYVRNPVSAIRPRYAGSSTPGHPVLIPRRWWDLLTGQEGDRGFAALWKLGIPVMEIPLDAENPDVDTPADLQAVATNAVQRT